ncbi:MAG: hypothetical protein IKC31_06740 [Clostridia bacterium]|nr:hypothetical protein [Clostridia bacterium]MBR2927256.1 hypothetical protein [Clostridia bacterium]
MKVFFKTYSYDVLKMFLNQFATAVFGCALAFAAGAAKSPTLRNVTSVIAILFYLFLLYSMTWDIGYREKVAVENGRIKRCAWRGALIALCANSLNFLFAVLMLLPQLLNVGFFSTVGGISSFLALFLEGMYIGLLANTVGGVPLNAMWWVWFLIPIPSILTCALAYRMGLADFKLSVALFGKKK